MVSEIEVAAMRRAIDASSRLVGTSNPNPCVGAVVLSAAGEVAGLGVTQPAGGSHAEVEAISAAGGDARGGTLLVTLEPCAHVGRTGACTDVILAAGISRVVYGLDDPHPVAAGGGALLAAAGVEVESGLLAEEAATVLGPWRVAAGRGRPYLTWKYAATLDGRVAAADGTSRWITSDAARRDVHRLRSEVDAVVTGIGTVLADDPQLSVRDWPTARQPLRVVIDSEARTPPDARVLDSTAETVVVVGSAAPAPRAESLRVAGADVVTVAGAQVGLDLGEVLRELAARDVYLAMLESGPTLAAGFVRTGLVDRCIGYYAPALLGDGPATLGDIGVGTITKAVRLTTTGVEQVGDDVRITTIFGAGTTNGCE